MNEWDLAFEVAGILNTSFGDANLDSIINQQHIDLLRSNYGDSAGWASGNLDLNTLIDSEDLARLRESQAFGSAQTSPEPGSALSPVVLGRLSTEAPQVRRI